MALKMNKLDVDERLKIVTLQKEKSDTKSGINWMYTGSKPDSEEYLLGKRIDKYVEGEDDTKSADPTVIFGERIKANIALDVAAKMREDPLFAIRRKEEESRKKLLENPMKMKELQKLIELQEKQKKDKEKKKKKKKKHKRSGDSGGGSSDDELMKKYLAILTSKHGGEEEPAQKKRKGGGGDESDAGDKRRNEGRGRRQDGRNVRRDGDVEDDRQHIDKWRNNRNDKEDNDRRDRLHGDRGFNDRIDRGHDRNGIRHNDRNDRGYREFNKKRPDHINDRHYKDVDDRPHNESYDRRQKEMKGYSDIKILKHRDNQESLSDKGHASQMSWSEGKNWGTDKITKQSNSSDSGSDRSEQKKTRHRHSDSEKSSGHSRGAKRSFGNRRPREGSQSESLEIKRRRSAYSETMQGADKARGRSAKPKRERQKDDQTREAVRLSVQKGKKGAKSPSSSSSSSISSSSSSSSSSDEAEPSKHKEGHGTGKKYGLILSGSHQPAVRRRSSSSSSSPGPKKKTKVETKPSVAKKQQSPPRRKLTQEEKAKKLAEMMENAEWREEQREMNVKRYKEEDLEKEKKDKQGGSGFISSLMVNHASTSSVEDRIKRNKYNIQRTRVALDKNFAKK